jgi:hypothetical protein
VYAYRVGKTKGGAVATYGATLSADVNPLTGKATIDAQPGYKYLFEASGQHKVGNIWTSYPPTWYGGYVGALIGTPKKVKEKTAPAAGKTTNVGTIKLKTYKGGINGKIKPAGQTVHFTNPVTDVLCTVQSGYEDPITGKEVTLSTYALDMPPGVYVGGYNGILHVFAIKDKKVTINFTNEEIPSLNLGMISTNISGAVTKGAKLKATSKTFGEGYKVSGVKFKYYWTDGTKILGRKSTYKVSKAIAKKGNKLYVITVATKKKHASSYTIDVVK